MEEFRKCLNEIYMNFDTIQYMKEENQSFDNIIEIFREELDYSEDLTTILLKYNKSFLRSVAIRIRLKIEKNIDISIIKQEILSYDKNLESLIEKLLVFKKKCDTNKQDENSMENNISTTIDQLSFEDDNEDNTILNFINNKIEETGDNKDIIKEKELYKYYCTYCKENDTDELSRDIFKESIVEKMGKCQKKGYEGFKVVNI